MMFLRSAVLCAIGLVAAVFPMVGGTGAARAGLIYNDTGKGSGDFVPFENDGTPNRPPGDHLGNQITFAGSARYLNHVQVVFASIGPIETDTYTLDLYKNNGPPDPNGSGLNQPGTLIAQLTTQAVNQPAAGNAGYGVDWHFKPILVPDTLTAVVSSSYSTTTPGQYMGPFVAIQPPLTGSGINTIWYGDGTPGTWQANSTWAIADGGVTNFFDMRFYASLKPTPEPGGITLAGMGLASVLAYWRLRRRTPRAEARP
jgi:MYXO-CTERM domain-containing protein